MYICIFIYINVYIPGEYYYLSPPPSHPPSTQQTAATRPAAPTRHMFPMHTFPFTTIIVQCLSVCVLCGSPMWPSPRWWVLCGVLPAVWVTCGWGPPLSCSRFPWDLFLVLSLARAHTLAVCCSWRVCVKPFLFLPYVGNPRFVIHCHPLDSLNPGSIW